MNTNIKKLNISDWVQAGEGGTAFTYNHVSDDSIMLKLFKPEVPDGEAKKEYDKSKAVEELGFNMPKAIDLVDLDGNIGIIYERINNKISFSRMITNDKNNISYCAKEMAIFGRKIHTTPCIPEYFPNYKDVMKEYISRVDFNTDINNMLNKKVISIKDENTCLHGDFQMGNFLNANGKTYMIDLGNFAYGNHMFDIGSLYFTCKVIITEKEKIDLFHMPLDVLNDFFDIFAVEYIKGTGIEKDAFIKESKAFSALFAAFVYLMQGKPKDKKGIYEDRIRELLG